MLLGPTANESTIYKHSILPNGFDMEDELVFLLYLTPNIRHSFELQVSEWTYRTNPTSDRLSLLQYVGLHMETLTSLGMESYQLEFNTKMNLKAHRAMVGNYDRPLHQLGCQFPPMFLSSQPLPSFLLATKA